MSAHGERWVRRVDDDEVRVMLAGDVMTGRGIDQAFAQSCAPELFEPWVRDAREYLRLAERANGPLPAPITPGHVWGDALAELDRFAPDARIVNLETAVTTSDRPWPGKGIHYRMHPANVGCLSAARIDCCVLANNHVMDWGREGLAQTLQTLQRAGLRTAGAGVEVWRGKLILYGCGDLINDYEGIGPHGELRSDLGCLYFAMLARATGELRDLRIVPMQLRGFRLSKPEPAAWSWLERLFGAALSRASGAQPTRASPEGPRQRRSPR